jgi:hypothetical protein
MSDSEERKRPNANYRLSNENANIEEITFYYDRERRLEKAPQAVRDLYKEEPPRRFGFFQSLVGSKPRAILFFTIIVLCAMIFILSSLDYFGSTYNLDGNRLSIQAISYEGTILVALKKTAQKNALSLLNPGYTGAVNIVVLPADNIQPENAFYHRVFFTHEETENYRFAVPFETDELLLIIQTEKRTLNVRIQPD